MLVTDNLMCSNICACVSRRSWETTGFRDKITRKQKQYTKYILFADLRNLEGTKPKAANMGVFRTFLGRGFPLKRLEVPIKGAQLLRDPSPKGTEH